MQKKKKYLNTSADLPAFWVKLIQSVPGYDPFRDAKGFYFDVKAAKKAIEFFPEFIKHVEGGAAGKPFELEYWQKFITANVFGWKDIKTGMRRYKKCFILVGKKNGKTTWAAALALYMTACDGEQRARVYCAAGSREQSGFSLELAKDMVNADERLSSLFNVYQHAIFYPHTRSFFQALSSEARTKQGMNPSFTIHDELHTQPGPELIDSLESGPGARQQPLTVFISTSDWDRPSICNEEQDYAEHVRDGLDGWRDPHYLPVIFKADAKDDPGAVETWRKANPNLGVTIQESFLREEYDKALKIPRRMSEFKRLFLNIKTTSSEQWLPMDMWRACNEQADPTDLRKIDCFAGLDLASVEDLTALVLAFRWKDGYALLPYFWMPEENAFEKQKKDRVPYINWAERGLIELTPGNVCDYDVIRKRIVELGREFDVKEIAFDRWNSTQIVSQLQEDGFTMVPFGQGFASMSGPSKEFEKCILSRAIYHNDNPVLTWMASNAVVERDAADNIKPAKHKTRSRIDGIVASIMAIGRASLYGQPTAPEVHVI